MMGLKTPTGQNRKYLRRYTQPIVARDSNPDQLPAPFYKLRTDAERLFTKVAAYMLDGIAAHDFDIRDWVKPRAFACFIPLVATGIDN